MEPLPMRSSHSTNAPHESTGQAQSPYPAIPGYEIVGDLGHGGLGRVYKARQIRLSRLVAVKVILAGEFAEREETVRFQHEAEGLARLQHPNIVQIFDMGDFQGQPYIVLEYVDGGNLAEKLSGNALSPAEAANLTETLARAVHAAHQCGVLHLDLKPANVLLTANGTPKIVDFGLAQHLLSTPLQPLIGAVMGTVGYLAPEEAGGLTGQVGPSADVYSLGAILYELLTGRLPYRMPTPLDATYGAILESPMPPSQLHAGIPRSLDVVCLKCLEWNPVDRYPAAEALADDLLSFQQSDKTGGRGAGLWQRARQRLRG
jgi:serine/threonine-protein kinase